MSVYLNKRQMDIIRKLENISQYITADSLAKIFGVSLRTIRNDISQIDYYLKDVDCRFEKIPHVGMRIISKSSISAELDSNYELDNYVMFDDEVKKNILSLLIIARYSEFITIGYLSELLDVSKNTIVRELNELNDFLKPYRLRLSGIKSKGFRITGDIRNKYAFIDDVLFNRENYTFISHLMVDDEYLWELREVVNSCIKWLESERNIQITDNKLFKTVMAFLICVSPTEKNDNTLLPDELLGLQDIIFKYNGKYLEASDLLFKMLYQSTTYRKNSEIDLVNDTEFQNALKKSVSILLDKYPKLKWDGNALMKDLTVHFQNTLERVQNGIDNSNPILDSIKREYVEQYNMAWELGKALRENYPEIPFDDNQAGFVALYIRVYTEKAESINEANVVVICNSGMGASILLTNRIMNAFPELHILMVKGYIDLKNDLSFMENVDLIVSTIEIPKEVKKPYLVVSPILSHNDMVRIRESIWAINKNRKHLINRTEGIRNKSFNIMENMNYIKAIDNYSPAVKNVNYHKMAEISLEALRLIGKLYPFGVDPEHYIIIEGLIAHVIMSVERWINEDFLEVNDYQEFKDEYPEEMADIQEFLQSVSRILDIFILPEEAVPILRYLTTDI
ncbi:MAG: transcription antiterminator [Erysipelotrichaceae bacterium]|nr:transcription antiterminator [Erysipelotrichaceae bacterium]